MAQRGGSHCVAASWARQLGADEAVTARLMTSCGLLQAVELLLLLLLRRGELCSGDESGSAMTLADSSSGGMTATSISAFTGGCMSSGHDMECGDIMEEGVRADQTLSKELKEFMMCCQLVKESDESDGGYICIDIYASMHCFIAMALVVLT